MAVKKKQVIKEKGELDYLKSIDINLKDLNELRECKSYYDMKTKEIKNLDYDKRLEFTFIQNEILSSIIGK
jgi:hypothetical protein